MTTNEAIEKVWHEHHIIRMPGHDMTNECRLAAVIISLEAEIAKTKSDAPVPGGHYRHSKTGNKYTVQSIGVYCGKWAPREVGKQAEGFNEGTRLVVYVGHYDNPRGNETYIRPVTEWDEGVDLPGATKGSTSRYVRIP